MFKQSFASRCVDSFGVSPDNVGWCWIYYAVKVNVWSLTLNRQSKGVFVNELCCVGQPHGPWVPGGCRRGAGHVSRQKSLLTQPFKGSQAQPRVPALLSLHPKSPLAWEEEGGERGAMAEEDKARERRICRELMGGELALCPGRFLLPWLRAVSSAPQHGASISPSIPAGEMDCAVGGMRRAAHQSWGLPQAPGVQGTRVCSSGV